MQCSICNSELRTLINARITQGVSGYKISAELREQCGVRVSKSAIYRHRKNCVLLPKKDSIYGMLYETGNRRLARAIERTQKVIKNYDYCECDSTTSRTLRKKGLVWICSFCGGWIPYNLGLYLKKRYGLALPRPRKLVSTGRSY